MKILFFDTETTGLPTNWNDPPKMWPRMVQLGFIQTVGGRTFKTFDSIIKPEGFEIPEPASDVHGISTEFATEYGRPLGEVLKTFGEAWRVSDLVVCHNYDFDANIMDGEAFRVYGRYFVREKPGFCTKVASTPVLNKIPKQEGGHNGPNLAELYQFCFGRGFDGAHDALNDVRATMECFFEMERRGFFNVNNK